MGLFNKVERKSDTDMLCLYIRHYRNIYQPYIDYNGDVQGFLNWRGLSSFGPFIGGPIPNFEEMFARQSGLGVVWDARHVKYYFPPAWFNMKSYMATGRTAKAGVDPATGLNILWDLNDLAVNGVPIMGSDQSPVMKSVRKNIINHANNKMLARSTLSESEKQKFFDDAGGYDLATTFAEKCIGYPCTSTNSIYFFVLLPSISDDRFLPDW